MGIVLFEMFNYKKLSEGGLTKHTAIMKLRSFIFLIGKILYFQVYFNFLIVSARQRFDNEAMDCPNKQACEIVHNVKFNEYSS